MAFQQGIPRLQERKGLLRCGSERAKTAGQHRWVGEQGMSDHSMMGQDIVAPRRVDIALHITHKGGNLLNTEGENPCGTHSARKSTWVFWAAHQRVEIFHV
jgi:hypothetical protein